MIVTSYPLIVACPAQRPIIPSSGCVIPLYSKKEKYPKLATQSEGLLVVRQALSLKVEPVSAADPYKRWLMVAFATVADIELSTKALPVSQFLQFLSGTTSQSEPVSQTTLIPV